MQTRGISKFEIDPNGIAIFNDSNLEKLRKLFLDRSLIYGDILGPGNPGDFDIGAWHVLCHLAGGCAVYKNSGNFMWVEISHVPLVDLYTATVTVETKRETVNTYPILSDEGKALLLKAELLGFVEGSSLGHISAKDIKDTPEKFNKWLRQDCDADEKSEKEAGRVWEQWCTVRDLTPNAAVGLSVLKAYLSMVAICGGKFVSIVARGRKQYHHPEQLIALIKYGLISKEDALYDIIPKPIPKKTELLIYSADPKICVNVVKNLTWDKDKISYYMFKRRIDKWSHANKVKNDLEKEKLI